MGIRHSDELFLRTLEDMENRLSASRPYDILQLSGLIRKLFLDGEASLVDQANKSRRAKIRFEIGVPDLPATGGLGSHLAMVQDGLDPETAPADKARKSLNRNQFFRTTVIESNADRWTI